jgi:hypothetical protein
MIFGSNLPSAQAFKSWVLKDVLPSIRKTGSYQLNAQLQTLKDDLAGQRLLTEVERKRADDANAAASVYQSEKKELADQIAPLQAAVALISETKEKWTKSASIPKPPMENVMYVASCTSLMLKSQYKIGGVGEVSKLPGRLSNYNSSHSADDPFFFVWIGKCYNYTAIENAFWTILEGFRDKQGTDKEMIRLRYEHIVAVLTETIAINTKNTETYAAMYDEFQRSTIEDTPVVQAKVDVPLSSDKEKKNQRAKPAKIDVGSMTTADIQAIITARIDDVARRTIPDYTFAADKNTKHVTLQWCDISPHFESYDKGTMWWRGQTQLVIADSKVNLVIRKKISPTN